MFDVLEHVCGRGEVFFVAITCLGSCHASGLALEAVAINRSIERLASASERLPPDVLAAVATFERENTVEGVGPSVQITHFSGGSLTVFVNEVDST